jgi:uncharacterized RDD family membrane protein YckC
LRLDDFTEVSLSLSKMGSALLDTTTELAFADAAPAPSASPEALRQEVAERLAAHRSRRGQVPAQRTQIPAGPSRPASSRAAQIAATVAERYAQSQSYRAFLAAEAERAIQQAHAAAEVAARNAQAVVAAQQQLLDAFDEEAVRKELNEAQPASTAFLGTRVVAHAEVREQSAEELSLWPDAEAPYLPAKTDAPRTTTARRSATKAQSIEGPGPAAGLTVRLYEDAASAAHVGPSWPRISLTRGNPQVERNDAEALALDEEIAFRQAPVFEEPAGPPEPLPANLIEFPRQLVAARKARPRLAEGPLRDEAAAAPGDGQLRIFEVDPALISTEPAVAESATPQWTSIWLDSLTGTPGAKSATSAESDVMYRDGHVTVPLQPATVGRRGLAAAIDAGIVFAGFAVSVAAFAVTTGHSLRLHSGMVPHLALREIPGYITAQTGLQPTTILGAGVAAAAFLCLVYQALFFSFSEATPGMRWARIALCTFDDENPTRKAMRRRMLAVLLSACPLGLGFLWATLDDEGLTWHDRISCMYQRSY